MDAQGVGYTFHETRGHGDARDIARALTQDAARRVDIVAMGGDGTLSEVLNGLSDPSNVRLGLVPCGSGNDFAATAGIPLTPDGALDMLLRGEVKYTDYMECGNVRGINAIGTGIDVDILRRYARMKLLKGPAAYLASLVITLLAYKPRQFSEETADGPVPHSAFIACAGNGQSIGGGICLCPDAKLDDGLLDVIIIDSISRLRYPSSLLKILKHKALEIPTARFHRADRLRIRADAPMPIQIDGEIYEGLPFDVRVVSGALRVYRP